MEKLATCLPASVVDIEHAAALASGDGVLGPVLGADEEDEALVGPVDHAIVGGLEDWTVPEIHHVDAVPPRRHRSDLALRRRAGAETDAGLQQLLHGRKTWGFLRLVRCSAAAAATAPSELGAAPARPGRA